MRAPEREQKAAAQYGGDGSETRAIVLYSTISVLVVGGAIGAIMAPVFVRARALAQWDACRNQLWAVSRATEAYVRANGGVLPDHRRWPEQLAAYGVSASALHCPASRSRSGISYIMNPQYSGARPGDYPDKDARVLFYEADEQGRPTPRHDGRTMCAYMDGRVMAALGLPDATGTVAGRRRPPAGAR